MRILKVGRRRRGYKGLGVPVRLESARRGAPPWSDQTLRTPHRAVPLGVAVTEFALDQQSIEEVFLALNAARTRDG